MLKSFNKVKIFYYFKKLFLKIILKNICIKGSLAFLSMSLFTSNKLPEIR